LKKEERKEGKNMTVWNEADHPRDDDGKFTYKNGGASNTTLYGGIENNNIGQGRQNISSKDTSSKKNLSNYRNKLLNVLGNSAEREDILYSSIPELEHKIIRNTVNRINDLRNQLNNTVNKLNNPISIYNNQCQKVLNNAQEWDNALGDFARNYNDMVEANTINADKYFHAKANCQAAQRGFGGETISQVLSTLRELEEGTRKVIFGGENLHKQIQDAGEDMKANKEGRMLGKQYPNINCKYLLDNKRPNGLDSKY